MRKFHTDFALKGHRAYVHGTTIFDEIIQRFIENIESITAFDISFKQRILITECTWYLSDERRDVDQFNDFCSGYFIENGKSTFFSLVPNSSSTNDEKRIDYDEDKIVSGNIINSNTITLQPSGTYSFIESLVALEKFYQNSVNPLKQGQWLFGRLSIKHIPDSCKLLTITEQMKIPNKLAKSQIKVDELVIGDIYFTAG